MHCYLEFWYGLYTRLMQFLNNSQLYRLNRKVDSVSLMVETEFDSGRDGLQVQLLLRPMHNCRWHNIKERKSCVIVYFGIRNSHQCLKWAWESMIDWLIDWLIVYNFTLCWRMFLSNNCITAVQMRQNLDYVLRLRHWERRDLHLMFLRIASAIAFWQKQDVLILCSNPNLHGMQ